MKSENGDEESDVSSGFAAWGAGEQGVHRTTDEATRRMSRLGQAWGEWDGSRSVLTTSSLSLLVLIPWAPPCGCPRTSNARGA